MTATTEPKSDFIAKLRAAWTASADAADSPRQTPATDAAPCKHGTDRTAWTDTPAPNRPGWIRTTCGRCGGFIGYRPIPKPPKRKRKANQ